MSSWIVEPLANGRWVVRRPGALPTAFFNNRPDAIAAAQRKVAGTGGGEVVVVHNNLGRMTDPLSRLRERSEPGGNEQHSPASHPVSRPGTPPNDFERADRLAKHTSEWLAFLSDHLWPSLALLLPAPVLNALIAPEVRNQGTIAGVFVATLAWSLAVAASVVILTAMYQEHQHLPGLPSAYVIVFCLMGAVFVANAVGVGTYHDPTPSDGGSAPVMILHFTREAAETWGPGGMILGAWAGFVSGWWFFQWGKKHNYWGKKHHD